MDSFYRHTIVVFLLCVLPSLTGVAADGIEGSYRIEKDRFCVGEPILIEVTVKNHSPSNFFFEVGGDYRGALRHDRFSIQVHNAADRDFTRKTTWGNMGGLGGGIVLLPGEQYRTYLLINGWTHLLPPGDYQLHCKSTFGSVVVEQTLKFQVEEYDRSRILVALKEMAETREIDRQQFKCWEVGKPIEWAYADLSEKFSIGLHYSYAVDGEAIASQLPEKWDDRFYLEYGFTSNRNWLTGSLPEQFDLIFTVRNNSNKVLPHGLMDSRLSVDGKDLALWQVILNDMLHTAGMADFIKPGQVIELKKRFNEFLTNADRQKLTWQIPPFTKTVEVSIRH